MMQIRDAKDLKLFRSRVNNGEVNLDAELLNDIDISETDKAGNNISWFPIGFKDNAYTGNFDGKGHVISGFYNDKYKYSNQGLFSRVSGKIENLIVGGFHHGGNRIGMIAGTLDGGSIKNCEVRGVCEGNYYVGGICGYCEHGEFIGCTNKATVKGQRPTGIVGNYDDKVKVVDCRNEGDLFIQTPEELESVLYNGFEYNQIGGNYRTDQTNKQNGKVEIPFQDSLLGFYLKNYHFYNKPEDIEYAFSKWLEHDLYAEEVNEAGETYLHLLCQNKKLHKTFAASIFIELIQLLAEQTVIDFGAKDNTGKVAASFLRDDKTGRIIFGLESVVGLIENLQQERAEEIKQVILDAERRSEIRRKAKNDPNPKCEYTEGEKFEIYTSDDLKKFRDRVNHGENNLNAILMNDIHIRETDENGEPISWEPIGAESRYDRYDEVWSEIPYRGTFDGNGYTISGLYIRREDEIQRSGLFGINEGKIKNLTVAGYIQAFKTAGGICDTNDGGIIRNCINACIVKSDKGPVGGIAATSFDGEIRNCINDGRVTGPRGGTEAITTFVRTSDKVKIGVFACINRGVVRHIQEQEIDFDR